MTSSLAFLSLLGDYLCFLTVDAAAVAARVSVGVMFYLSGSWKVFAEPSRLNLFRSIKGAGIPMPLTATWFVAVTELLAGLALVAGAATRLAAFGLLTICLTACLTEYKRKKIKGNLVDKVGEVLMMPEWLLAVILVWIVAYGSGPWSADTIVSAAMQVSTDTQISAK
jgi:putative oxidoreductase